MKITVVGMYGSETLGDRAIFAGIFQLVRDALGQIDEIRLVSFNPQYSTRLAAEDSRLCYDCHGRKIGIYDARVPRQIDAALCGSDLLIYGGGPLMDDRELRYSEYAFLRAAVNGVRSLVMGVGVGPFRSKRSFGSIHRIFDCAAAIIFRDSGGKDKLSRLDPLFLKYSHKMTSALDPAVHFAHKWGKQEDSNDMYRTLQSEKRKAPIFVNIRAAGSEYQGHDNLSINSSMIEILRRLREMFGEEQEIELVPMNFYHTGGDDREIMAEVVTNNDDHLQSYVTLPLDLSELFKKIYLSPFCVGMRYHSVVLQSILNGRNIVLDYTGEEGKTKSFLADIAFLPSLSNRVFATSDICKPSERLFHEVLSRPFVVNPETVGISDDMYRQTLRSTLWAHLEDDSDGC